MLPKRQTSSLGRIKPGKIKGKKGRIHPPSKASIDHETLRFSFQHLEISHEKFRLDGRAAQYFIKLFERLQNLSSLKHTEFTSNRGNSLRSHPIDWGNTSEKDGFTHLNNQLKGLPPCQFQVSKNNGRVHGFLLDNVFFVVWFDPDHLLYPK